MAHDFRNFPELTTDQMQIYYFDSPHKQIFADFDAKVTKVHDADTVTVRWQERTFDFPIRLYNVSAREIKETSKRDTSFQLSADGKTAQKWLEDKILGEMVTVKVNSKKRVEKFGRLLGRIEHKGVDVGDEAATLGLVVPWRNRNDGKMHDSIKEGEIK